MKTNTAYLIAAWASMVLCIVSVAVAAEPGNQAVKVVFVATDHESVDFVPVEPRPDADDTLGEVSLSDTDSQEATPISSPAPSLDNTPDDDYPVHEIIIASSSDQSKYGDIVSKEKVSAVNVSLSTPVDKQPTVLDDSILAENTCDVGGYGDCFGPLAGQTDSHFWVRADYLLWWTRGSNIPPLITTSTDQNDNGILGQPTTEILFGGSRETSAARSAPRITMGYWFDCCQKMGIQLDYFNLGQDNNNYSNSSDGSTLLARPFYSVLGQGQAAQLIAKENIVEGDVRVDANDYFDSFGIMGRWNICCHQPCYEAPCCEEYCGESCADSYGARHRGSLRHILSCLGKPIAVGPVAYRVDLIGGYRSYNLDDNLTLTENLTTINIPFIPPGTTFDIQDSFRANNEFHGGELGIIATAYRGRWSLEMMVKMALGNNSQTVSINGSTDIARPGDDPVQFEGGLLALETNIGRYHRDEFVVIPQFGIELGYCLSERLRAYFGYNFLYWANVARAAEQIDTNVNTSYIPPVGTPTGPRVPAFSFQDSAFWAQGLNFGLEYNF